MYAFDLFLSEFKFSKLWATMAETVEASPWHREANVAVHTEMVIEQYRTRFAPFRSDLQNTIALVALLFHDVGKPSAEEVLDKKDGSGKYRRYAGHEQDSAVAFTEEYIRNKQLRQLISAQQARIVRWIIEHHLPYGLKDKNKVTAFRTAMVGTLSAFEETFYDCLRSDAAGRISDDHDTKLANVEAWITEFKAVQPEWPIAPAKTPAPIMYLLVGPSGSGKSTWTGAQFKPNDVVLSLDTMRLQFVQHMADSARTTDEQHQEAVAALKFGSEAERYSKAWVYATEHEKEFNIFIAWNTRNAMEAAVKTSGNVFIDNTNSSRKRRAQWVALGRKHGFKIVAVEFWNALDTLISRQKTRGDKQVPAASVEQQQYAMTCAWLGHECEDVILVIGTRNDTNT